jgi:hypothetical protein
MQFLIGSTCNNASITINGSGNPIRFKLLGRRMSGAHRRDDAGRIRIFLRRNWRPPSCEPSAVQRRCKRGKDQSIVGFGNERFVDGDAVHEQSAVCDDSHSCSGEQIRAHRLWAGFAGAHDA